MVYGIVDEEQTTIEESLQSAARIIVECSIDGKTRDHCADEIRAEVIDDGT
jgi:hypothetical protein